MANIYRGNPAEKTSICIIDCACGHRQTFSNTEKRIYSEGGMFWIDCPKCGNSFRLSLSFVIGD